MSKFRRQTWVLVLLALLALFAGCKGESSPTAPPVTGPGSDPGNGGVTPVTGAVVTLSVSTATPVVTSASIITATVTVDGKPAPNGTAVEFSTDIGSFCLVVEGCAEPTTNPIRAALRTTTGGTSTIVLTSASAGTATVQAVVNNVSSKTTVRFTTAPVEPPKPNTDPAIVSVAPALGRPAGGETIVITGRNFTAPVRVLFTTAAGVTKEGQVISASATEIRVLTPSFDVGTTQQLVTTVTVINNVGSATETRVTSAAATFTYQLTVLTPKITTASPASGPINGGTRVTLFGEGFQFPLQVFFGAQEAEVISATFNQVVVLSPSASSTSDVGSGPVVGPVSVRVVNIASGTTTTASALFRYTPKMQITGISPNTGSAIGGTDVRIDGSGFDDPLQVFFATGVQADVIRVSGSQLLVRTRGLPSPCAGASGTVIVRNLENGDEATSPGAFTYIGVPAVITSVTSTATPVLPGSSLQVAVRNPGIGPLGSADIRLTVADQSVPASPNFITTGTGTQTFTTIVPANIDFPTVACTAGGLAGTQLGPVAIPVVFQNVTTGCGDTLESAITVTPPGPNACVTPPTASLTSPAQSCPAPNLTPPSAASAGAVTHTATITIANLGSSPLTLSAPAVTPTNATVLVSPNTAGSVAGGASASYTVTVDPTAAGPDGATINFTTNDPAHSTVSVVVCGSGT
jgi:hypothetical protein